MFYEIKRFWMPKGKKFGRRTRLVEDKMEGYQSKWYTL